MRFFQSTLPTALLLTALYAAGAGAVPPVSTPTAGVTLSGNKITARMGDVPPPATNDRLRNLQAVVEADKEQTHKSGGIRFAVTITNSGRQAVSIYNPLDFLRVDLRNKEGKPVELPTSYSRFQLDGKKGMAERFYLPVYLNQVTLSGRTLTLRETQMHSFALSPKARLRMEMSINQIVTETKMVPVQNTPGVTSAFEPSKVLGSIPAGSYQVELEMLLRDLTDTQTSRWVKAGIFSVELN